MLGELALISSSEFLKKREQKTLPVHDMVCVAVVDALKDLLHQNGGIFFSELASRDNFIKEFTALAYSISRS